MLKIVSCPRRCRYWRRVGSGGEPSRVRGSERGRREASCDGGRAAEIGERSVPDLSHDGTEAVKSEVEADPTLGEEGPSHILSVYTDA
jgi:hypothetical protein